MRLLHRGHWLGFRPPGTLTLNHFPRNLRVNNEPRGREQMIRTLTAMTVAVCLAGCGDGNPFTDDDESSDDPGAVFFDKDSERLVVNNIGYDPATDQVIINNIPFDDPNNRYDRIPTEAFTNNFDAYQSNPAPGSNEVQYFAVFRRTPSSQVAAAGTGRYIDFGYAGAGAQRLGSDPTLPTSGIYSYNGEYAAVRTTLVTGSSNTVEYVTGDVALSVDYDDFDGIGAVGGTITNRALYDTTGAPLGPLAGFISLQDADIDFENHAIVEADATELDGTGAQVATGNWAGVFAGPNGQEIAGIVFVNGATTQEVGGLIANR